MFLSNFNGNKRIIVFYIIVFSFVNENNCFGSLVLDKDLNLVSSDIITYSFIYIYFALFVSRFTT